jgi:hypothetical protein
VVYYNFYPSHNSNKNFIHEGISLKYKKENFKGDLMKVAMLMTLLSFSVTAVAADCYTRSVDLVTNEVSLAREICIEEIAMNLDVFGKSSALIKYTLDGVEASKEVSLLRPIESRNGKYLFNVSNLQKDSRGGWCSEITEASIYAVLVMNKDASGAMLEEIEGSVSTSWDSCHSPSREIQKFNYKLN